MAVTVTTPKSRQTRIKIGRVDGDLGTAAQELFVLEKGTVPISVRTVSSTAFTATCKIGTATDDDALFVATAVAAGSIDAGAAVGVDVGKKLTADAKYQAILSGAEAGEAILVIVEYVGMGPGEGFRAESGEGNEALA